MGLPADQLSPGETVILEMHEHWKHLLGAILICLAALVGLAVVLAVGPEDGFFAWLDTLGWCWSSASGRRSPGGTAATR